jgi:hypothetical protein
MNAVTELSAAFRLPDKVVAVQTDFRFLPDERGVRKQKTNEARKVSGFATE